MTPGPWFANAERVGKPRIRAATAWLQRWRVDESWVHVWAVYALSVWRSAHFCRRESTSCECSQIRRDDDFALRAVTPQSAIQGLGEPPRFEYINEVVSRMDDPRLAHLPLEQLRPPHRRPPLLIEGPQPAIGTRDEFLKRMARAWDEAEAALKERDGVSLTPPHGIERHSKWLVRRQVLRRTARQIIEAESSPQSENLNTVNTAIRNTAKLIGLTLDPVHRPRRAGKYEW
jgi:hypothetical protein